MPSIHIVWGVVRPGTTPYILHGGARHTFCMGFDWGGRPLKFPTSKNSMAHYSLPGYPSTPNEYPNQLVQVPPYRVSNNVSLSQLSHMYKKSQSRPPRLHRRLDSAAAYYRPKVGFSCHIIGLKMTISYTVLSRCLSLLNCIHHAPNLATRA